MLTTAQKSNDVITYLKGRRSCPLTRMAAPGPSHEEINTMLELAARVPDHGKLFPWHYIVFDGQAREDIAPLLREAYLTEEPDAAEAKLELESQRFTRAPLVILVISRIRPGNKPQWEQILSAGASCYNLSLAANALGYGANWVTEWYSFNDTFRKGLGLDNRDHIAGAVYIGTMTDSPEERDRPDVKQLTTFWTPDVTLNKGDCYDQTGKDFPVKGFSL